MTIDRLNRRGGAVPASRRTLDTTTTDAAQLQQQQQQQQQLREALLASTPPQTTTSAVTQSLKDAMPRLLLRVAFLMLLFAGVATGAALYFASNNNEQLKSISSSKDSYQFTPVAKTAATPRQQQHRSAGSNQQQQTAVQVLTKYPHDAAAFTQGLLVAHQGDTKVFIESTGLFGESTLRKVDIATGAVLGQYDLPLDVFGEGVTLTHDGDLVMLSWKNARGFVFRGIGDTRAFSLIREFPFSTTTGEGWGIDLFGTNEFVVSDGSATLQFWDRTSLRETRRVTVTFNGAAVAYLNELEVAHGFVYANIWYQRVLAKIDPISGAIVAVFDCSALADAATTGADSGAVLNGIAYDGDDDVFYLTGKLWNAVYKVRLVETTA